MSSKYRKSDGTLVDFDVIKGESAFESAQIGGYSGTEEEFYQSLGDIATKTSVNDKIDSVLTEFDEKINNISIREYPDYCEVEMQKVLDKIKAYSDLDDCVVIGFSTDQHLRYDNEKMRNEEMWGLRTLRDLTKAIPFNVICLGGDCSSTNTTILELQQDVYDTQNQLVGANCPVIHISGNHDCYQNITTIQAGAVFKSHLTEPLIKKIVTKQKETNNCYLDDETCNVRFIFLWSQNMNGYSKDSAKVFLGEALASMSDTQKAIIFSHHPLGNLSDDTSIRTDWNEPLNWGDVVNPYASKIICCIDGHTHNNLDAYVDNILYISTTTAGRYELNDGSTRTYGQADCTAYDVFVIDKKKEIVHAIRYGNGEDRELVYKVHSFNNAITTSIDTDNSVYEGVGYKLNSRLNSSGTVIEKVGCGVTGFIPIANGDIIRLKNCELSNVDTVHDYVATYDRSFTKISSTYAKSNTHISDKVVDSNNCVTQFTVLDDGYLRISASGINEDAIITVNEEIV